MEAYAGVLAYAIPGFVILILIEYVASRIMQKDIANSMDTISSLSSGMTNTLKELIGLAVVIVSYQWMVSHISLFMIPSTVGVYIVAFILIDFASYWSHRFNHEYNVLWNRHIVHHSSEEFNLSCALRQSISAIVGIYFFLYIPMAIIGIPAKVIAILAPLHLFAQFWYHTRLINRLGFLEYIIVTPSQHRVHHAINEQYIDKNYAAIFIVWDKWFGTFQKELGEVPAVYGVKKPVRTWNPILINYVHMWQLIKDAWRANNIWDKIRIWFMPTGWRPKDVIEKYPIKVIDDVYIFEKYNPEVPKGMKTWSWFQLIFHNLLMYLMMIQIADSSLVGIGLYVTFLFVSIFAYTSLMDNHPIALVAESIKFLLGMYILLSGGTWFNIETYIEIGPYLIGIYLLSSFIITTFFLYQSKALRSKIEASLSY